MLELEIASTIDGSKEKTLFYHPATAEKVPLVVGLHTWSYDRFNQVDQMLPLCMERDWALLLPEFRGPNLSSNPRSSQACGSAFARRDILDAIDAVTKTYPVDNETIFLLGGSGGGHMALLMAACAPRYWKAVSSWVPITDLAAWSGENDEYAPHVTSCCGGKPGEGEQVDREYRERSPLSFIKELSSVNLSIHHGRHDPLVHYSHSWKLALELEKHGADRFYFGIFDGGHEIHYEQAFSWFDKLAGRTKESGVELSG